MSHSNKISVILPVRNESERIASALQYLRKTSSKFSTEIILVDGQSADSTLEIAKCHADVALPSPKASRSFQMHLGAQNFFHAAQTPAAAAFRLSFDSNHFFYKMLACLARLRSFVTGVPHGDQALLIPREIYFRAGGFPDEPLMEEYLLIPRVKRIGEVRILKESIVTSRRKYERKGPMINALKNFLLILLFYAGVSPKRLASWY